MSFRTDDDAAFWLERHGLKMIARNPRACLNPEGKKARRDTVTLMRRTGGSVTGYLFPSDFMRYGIIRKATFARALSLVMFAARPWADFKADNAGEPITPESLRAEWLAWQRLAKPFRAFLTAEELAGL